jgi:hypothetical protein
MSGKVDTAVVDPSREPLFARSIISPFKTLRGSRARRPLGSLGGVNDVIIGSILFHCSFVISFLILLHILLKFYPVTNLSKIYYNFIKSNSYPA